MAHQPQRMPTKAVTARSTARRTQLLLGISSAAASGPLRLPGSGGGQGPWSLLDVGHRVALLTVCVGRGAGAAIGIDHGVDAVGHRTIMPGKDVIEDVGDRDPPDGAVEEGLHRHLVRRRSATPGPSRPPDRPRRPGRGSAKVARSGGSKSSRRSVAQSICPNGVASALGVGQGVADGQAHVGHRQLGDGGPVGELDHRVDHRLGVDDHLDVVVAHAEQLVGLDDLEPLVHQRAGVDGDLRSHAPGGMGQRLRRR